MRFMHLLSQVPAAEHPPHQEPVHGVPGAFLVHDVLSEDECARLMDLTEQVGFCSGESLVEVPRSLRGNDVAVVVVDARTATTLARRLEAFLPTEGHGGARRCGDECINRRWRCYRYLPPAADGSRAAQFFGPHHDGPQGMSGVRGDELIDEVPPKGVTRLSQMSVLLYLNDGHAGGETVFYPSGAPGDAGAVRVAPRAGSALCFFHGHHPLSPLHEGVPLEPTPPPAAEPGGPNPSPPRAPKYVIRTDVLFATEANFHGDAWESSNVVAAMLRAASM